MVRQQQSTISSESKRRPPIRSQARKAKEPEAEVKAAPAARKNLPAKHAAPLQRKARLPKEQKPAVQQKEQGSRRREERPKLHEPKGQRSLSERKRSLSPKGADEKRAGGLKRKAAPLPVTKKIERKAVAPVKRQPAAAPESGKDGESKKLAQRREKVDRKRRDEELVVRGNAMNIPRLTEEQVQQQNQQFQQQQQKQEQREQQMEQKGGQKRQRLNAKPAAKRAAPAAQSGNSGLRQEGQKQGTLRRQAPVAARRSELGQKRLQQSPSKTQPQQQQSEQQSEQPMMQAQSNVQEQPIEKVQMPAQAQQQTQAQPVQQHEEKKSFASSKFEKDHNHLHHQQLKSALPVTKRIIKRSLAKVQ